MSPKEIVFESTGAGTLGSGVGPGTCEFGGVVTGTGVHVVVYSKMWARCLRLPLISMLSGWRGDCVAGCKSVVVR